MRCHWFKILRFRHQHIGQSKSFDIGFCHDDSVGTDTGDIHIDDCTPINMSSEFICRYR